MAVPCSVQPGFQFTIYPCGIDSSAQLPLAVDNVTPINAEVINRHREAIIAIESELGIAPSGTFTTVRQRLDALEGLIAQISGQGNPIAVQENGTPILSTLRTLNFTGSSVTVTNAGNGQADVNILAIGGGVLQVQETRPASNNQTTFTLSQTPLDDNAVLMFINGIKQEHVVEYTVVNTVVNFTGIPVVSTDIVEFWYITAGTVTQVQESIPVTVLGQTNFTLSTAPSDDTAVMMFINGLKQEEGVGYSVSGTSAVYSGPLTLDPLNDVVEFWYISSGAGGGGGGGNQSLAQTLNIGNLSDGYDIILSGGSNINAAGGTVTLGDDTSVLGDLSVSGKLTVTGLIDPTGLVLDPQATDPIPGGSSGIWVDNSSPTNLFFTDDAGTAFQLNGAAGSQDLATTLGIGNITGGNNIVITSGDQITGSLNVPIFGGASASAAAAGQVAIIGGANSSSGAGGDAFVNGGSANSGTGGSVDIGAGNSTSGTGGDVEIRSGAGPAAGSGGDIVMRLNAVAAVTLIEEATGEFVMEFGNGFNPVTLRRQPSLTNPSTLNIFGQNAGAATAFAGGDVVVIGGTGGSTGSGGDVIVRGGLPQGPGDGGDVFLYGENSSLGGDGGDIELIAGSGFNGGDVLFAAGIGTGGNDGYIGLDGYVDVLGNKITNLALPTAPEDAANKEYVDSVSGNSEREYAFKLTGLFSGAGVPGTFEPPRPILNSATIDSVTLLRRNPGISGTTRVDLLVNNVSIFASDPVKPQVSFSDGTNAINTVTAFTSTTLAINDIIDVELETVEAGSAEDLIVIVRVTES